MKSLQASATPVPRPIARADRRGAPGSGIVLALFLAVPFWICLAVVARIAWPILRDAANAAADVLWVVGL